MSNIEEDIKILKESIKKANTEDADMNDCFETKELEAIENILSEREQDKFEINNLNTDKINLIQSNNRLIDKINEKDKRIKELEEDNLHWRGKYLIALDGIGMIPKQKVIDRINYCDERIKHAKQIRDKEQEEFYIDLKRAFNKLLEEK